MLTMQYRFVLPADYDMAIIRQRIVERGHLTDAFPQLAFKAYLFADRSAPCAAGRENLYAPFYLWRDTEGMNAFLGGAGFSALVASFGRPIVRTASVWHADSSPDFASARHATREIVPIPVYRSLQTLRDEETARNKADLAQGALAAVSAFDPAGWTLTRLRLWRDAIDRPAGDEVDVYEVGHISQPVPNNTFDRSSFDRKSASA